MEDLKTEQIMSALTVMGEFYELRHDIHPDKITQKLDSFRESWVPYNKSKTDFNRFGLSLTSIDGSTSGEIDLNSLHEQNEANGTNYTEMSFRTKTPFWEDFGSELDFLNPVSSHIGRCHFLRLDQGGFFPPHRDLGPSFRLIGFFNCTPMSLSFIQNEKQVQFQCGRIYFANTRLVHSLVSFEDSAYVLVINLALNEETLSFVINNLEQT